MVKIYLSRISTPGGVKIFLKGPAERYYFLALLELIPGAVCHIPWAARGKLSIHDKTLTNPFDTSIYMLLHAKRPGTAKT